MRRFLPRFLVLCAVVLAGSPAVQAIPEAQALEKLRLIPVHLLVDAKGVPLPIPRQKTLLLPLYLDRQRAHTELQIVRSRHPELTVALATLPLSEANSLVQELAKDLQPGFRLSAPVVPSRQDMEKATALLRQKGVSAQRIRDGLTVPVFFTRPFLTSPTPDGERGLLFLSHGDLQSVLAGQSADPPRRVEVADITAVLHRIMQAPQDLFVFRPAPDNGPHLQAPPPPPPPPSALPVKTVSSAQGG